MNGGRGRNTPEAFEPPLRLPSRKVCGVLQLPLVIQRKNYFYSAQKHTQQLNLLSSDAAPPDRPSPVSPSLRVSTLLVLSLMTYLLY